MRILIISFFYPPDIGPGALRAKSIVESLVKEGPSELKIDVLTTMPNRYHSLNISALQREVSGKVSINRFKLPKHKNRIFDQSRAFLLFSLFVQKFIFKKKWDIVVATSGRLMTASLATWVSKQTGSKLYLDVRDLFTDTMKNILIKNPLRIIMPIFNLLEKWCFRSADNLNVVSAGFLNYLKKIAPNLSPSVYTNGVDEIFLKNDFSISQTKQKPLLLYAGNIGDGQGLDKIIPLAARKLTDINFKLIGDGSARKILTNNKLFKSQNNIEILKPILRNELIKEYKEANILFLHLNDLDSFNKVLPSKIFEYAATGKPILAGVKGYAAKFLRDHVKGVEIFNPNDFEGMKAGLRKLLNGPKIIDRSDFCENYSRSRIIKKLSNDILSLMTIKNKFIPSKILITHRYYWPDKTPCSSILNSIAKHLSKLHKVDVLTSQPSYGFGKFFPTLSSFEVFSNLSIRRLSLSNENNSSAKRLINAAYLAVWILIKCIIKKYDIIIVTTTPPILSAFCATLVKKLTKTKVLYYGMDINPEIGKKVSNDFKNLKLFKFLLKMDDWSCKNANLIFTNSQDMVNTLKKRHSGKKYNLKIINNFPPETVENNKNKKNSSSIEFKNKLKIIYTGNVGRFQDLQKIIDGMELIMHRQDIELLIVGDGIRKKFFKEKAKKLKNVKFFDYQPIEVVKNMIDNSDIGLVTLDEEMYNYSYPSKIGTYLQLGKPIICSVENNSEIVKQMNSLGYGFEVKDKYSVEKLLIKLADNDQWKHKMKLNAFNAYNKHFSSKVILNQWSKAVNDLSLIK